MLTIDLEFKALYPVPTFEQSTLLKSSLIAEGCRDEIIVWRGHDTILDGHHRYRICEHLSIPFQVRSLDLPSRQAAIGWIIANQFARRNLTTEQRSYLRGKRYLAEKREHGGDRKSSGSSAQNAHLISTASELAFEYDVHPSTIRRDAKFARAVDLLASTDGEYTKQAVLAGKLKAPKRKALDSTKLRFNRRSLGGRPMVNRTAAEAIRRIKKPPQDLAQESRKHLHALVLVLEDLASAAGCRELQTIWDLSLTGLWRLLGQWQEPQSQPPIAVSNAMPQNESV